MFNKTNLVPYLLKIFLVDKFCELVCTRYLKSRDITCVTCIHLKKTTLVETLCILKTF